MSRQFCPHQIFALALLISCSAHAANNDDMQALLDRARAVRSIVVCGDAARANEDGPRSDQDFEKVEKGAKAGSGVCQLLIGRWYEKGTGIKGDYALAKEWYQAATSSAPAAYVALGRMAELGLGEAASPEHAVAFYRKASDANDPSGHVALGKMYETGMGTEKNLDTAAELYRRAAHRWNDEAFAKLDSLQSANSAFTSDQIQADRSLWLGLLTTRFQTRLENSPDLRQFDTSRNAKLTLEFMRGKQHPAVVVSESSKDDHFDQVACDIAAGVSMPAAPIYSSDKTTFRIDIPVNYVANPLESPASQSTQPASQPADSR
jgi:tetratricopeptide (TPR) repeat protein